MPTSIVLGIQKPKISAVFGTDSPTVADDEMAIFVPDGPIQQIVGDLHHLYRYSKTNIGAVVGFGSVGKDVGDSESGIELGFLPGQVVMYFGDDVNARSHMLHRTFIRLVELYLEVKKGDSAPPLVNNPVQDFGRRSGSASTTVPRGAIRG